MVLMAREVEPTRGLTTFDFDTIANAKRIKSKKRNIKLFLVDEAGKVAKLLSTPRVIIGRALIGTNIRDSERFKVEALEKKGKNFEVVTPAGTFKVCALWVIPSVKNLYYVRGFLFS